MNIERLRIESALLLSPDRVVDERGWFSRIWDAALIPAGRPQQQSVASNTAAGTVRGMHLAIAPAQEVKIVRCTRGTAFDVIVDARLDSPTCGDFITVTLRAEEYCALVIPPGCAHGYQTLVDDTDLQYDISEPYQPEFARGFHFADVEVGIPWPLPVTALSERDEGLPAFAEFLSTLRNTRTT